MAIAGSKGLPGVWGAYRLRWKRRRFLFRIWRKRREIDCVKDRTSLISDNTILLFSTVRNEAERLPYFLRHYRELGVGHFLFVDNDSDDGTAEMLASQPDVSLWRTNRSYRLARFGMDWIGWLQLRYGHKHWCLAVDADELLVYPDHRSKDLRALTQWMSKRQITSMGAMMLDLYPKGSVTAAAYSAGNDPVQVLNWYDADNYRHRHHSYYGNLWIQGGPRERVFFTGEPDRAPSLNKTPLVFWNRRYAYVSSTHQILPRRLHDSFGAAAGDCPSGVLLHTKFLPMIADKSSEELRRKQHFENTSLYEDYHQRLSAGPDLWHEGSSRYEGTQKLIDQGLMSKGRWV